MPRRDGSTGLGLRASRRRVTEPLPKAHFRVFLGREEVGVESISPLHLTDEGHPDPVLRQTVTLSRAVGTDRTLFDWRAAVTTGTGEPRDVVIAQLDRPGGKPLNIWRLEKAVPIRWSGPDFDALSGEIAYEELELRYQTITWRTRA